MSRLEKRIVKLEEQGSKFSTQLERLIQAPGLCEEEIKYFRFMRKQCESMGNEAVGSQDVGHQSKYSSQATSSNSHAAVSQQLTPQENIPSPIRSVSFEFANFSLYRFKHSITAENVIAWS